MDFAWEDSQRSNRKAALGWHLITWIGILRRSAKRDENSDWRKGCSCKRTSKGKSKYHEFKIDLGQSQAIIIYSTKSYKCCHVKAWGESQAIIVYSTKSYKFCHVKAWGEQNCGSTQVQWRMAR